MTTLKKADYDQIHQTVQRLLLGSGVSLHGTEPDIINSFKIMVAAKNDIEDRIPLKTALDTIVYEMAFKYGRADIVIFHIDGSASVIEAKDGSKGYSHVIAGIGQAALYSSQLCNKRNSLTKVRKCLLWTSTGDINLDCQIEIACEQSNTVPLPWHSMKKLIAGDIAVLEYFGAAHE